MLTSLLVVSKTKYESNLQLGRNVSIQYFRYETSTEWTIARKLPVEPPSVNTCFELRHIVVDSKYHELMNGSQRYLSDLSIQELFAVTPESSEIAKRCQIHDHDSYEWDTVNFERLEIKTVLQTRHDLLLSEARHETIGVQLHYQRFESTTCLFRRSPYYTFF